VREGERDRPPERGERAMRASGSAAARARATMAAALAISRTSAGSSTCTAGASGGGALAARRSAGRSVSTTASASAKLCAHCSTSRVASPAAASDSRDTPSSSTASRAEKTRR
jgi:hypothetical protein